MGIVITIRTCDGIEEVHVPTENMGHMECECIKKLNSKNADLIALFLDEECTASGLDTPEKLFRSEKKYITEHLLQSYPGTKETGAQLSIARIITIFDYIWEDPNFWEETGMNYDMIHFARNLQKTEDPDELLFWSFRFCSWGNSINNLPYTLYKGIIDGRFNSYYNSYLEWLPKFLYIDTTDR